MVRAAIVTSTSTSICRRPDRSWTRKSSANRNPPSSARAGPAYLISPTRQSDRSTYSSVVPPLCNSATMFFKTRSASGCFEASTSTISVNNPGGTSRNWDLSRSRMPATPASVRRLLTNSSISDSVITFTLQGLPSLLVNPIKTGVRGLQNIAHLGSRLFQIRTVFPNKKIGFIVGFQPCVINGTNKPVQWLTHPFPNCRMHLSVETADLVNFLSLAKKECKTYVEERIVKP